MKHTLLKRVLPLLLSLALLLALAPASALRTEAAAPPTPELPLPGRETPGPGSDLRGFEDLDAMELELNTELILTVDADQEYLWFHFTPQIFDQYCISSFGDADVDVMLFDGEGRYINEDDNGGPDYNFRLASFLDPGQLYYFRVWCHPESDESLRFSILLKSEGFNTIEIEPDEALEASFAVGQSCVWLRFSPPCSASYCLSSFGEIDTFADLFDGNLGWLCQDDDSGDGRNFSLTRYLEAGKTYHYRLGHNRDSDKPITYTVLLTEYEQIISGECGAQGDNLLWSYDRGTGVLTIEGSGDMRDYDFTDAPWEPYFKEITEVRLPDGMTSIGACAFCDLWALAEIEIPDTVDRIGCGAFCRCGSLSAVSLPAGLSSIEASTFDCCSSLLSIAIPEGVTDIGDEAFLGCVALASVSIPETVRSIGTAAFADCEKLPSVKLPDGLTYLGADAFADCRALGEVAIPAGIQAIPEFAFFQCRALRSVTLPAGLSAIGDSAFLGCYSLSAVDLPESVRTIGADAFRDCVALASVKLPADIARIEARAFEGCGMLEMLVIRNADCLAGFMIDGYDPDATEEDLENYLSDRTLGDHQTVIYGRHDQAKLDSGDVEELYQYAEAYAVNHGYTFYDLYAFRDVKEYSWYEIPVAWACGKGITAGTDVGIFSPGKPCTREQTVAFLWKAAGSPAPETMENPFRDVKPHKYYYPAVLWALENGITAGVDADLFGVGQTCTREQVVTFLWKAAGSPAPKTTENPFRDVKSHKYYYPAVLWAVENGITAGVDVDLFGVGLNCTRAQIVTFLYLSRKLLAGTGTYARGDDDAICRDVFGEFEELMEQSRSAQTNDERFVLEARAEAALLDTAAMIPLYCKGGSYALSRVAPHTKPFVQWGNGSNRLHGLVISEDFLTPAERAELEAQWEAAASGNGGYDPAAYLTGKGHRLLSDLTATFTSGPRTLDWLNTASITDTFVLSNCVDSLVEYDELGRLRPALAESWEVSADGLTYTFHIRPGVKWSTKDGAEYAELTASDFVAGFRHMLDCEGGPEALAGRGGAGILGVEEYLWEGGSFDAVGCKATDDHTLVYTLSKPVPYFMTMLSYGTFLPLCDSFYRANGGVYGVEEYRNALDNGTYHFAEVGDLSSQVYCGPYLPQKIDREDEILCEKNPNYYQADRVRLDSIRWIFSYNYPSYQLYEDTVNGILAEITLSEAAGTLDQAFYDGNFDRYAYITETENTSYFGSLNLNRGAFELENGGCASPKSEQEKSDAHTALNNKNFRKALQHAFDKTAYNAVTRGDMLAEASLRNMYTTPNLVRLENAFTDAEGHSFPAGTLYGDMVQYYCDLRGCLVDCADGRDGWFKPDAARDYLDAAKAELGSAVSWPIQIDVVYYAGSYNQADQAWAYRDSIEAVLGSENVVVNLISTDDVNEYYACNFMAPNGASVNTDMSWNFGWAPDYGDPSSYLNTFDRRADGYMLFTVGLY